MSFFDSLRRLKSTKVMPTLRVLTYVTCVSAGIAAMTTQRAKADVTEQAFVFGRDMAKVADMLDHTYPITINGQTAFFASNEVLLPMKEILDRYEDVCLQNRANEAWKNVPEKVQGEPIAGNFIQKLGTIRKEEEHEGVVACLIQPDGSSTVSNEGFTRFLKTGELGYIGKLRYVHVTGPSPSGRYTVTSLWTEDSFNMDELLPHEDGTDNAGTDSPLVGRPPNGRRFFSASIGGSPYAFRIYTTPSTPEMVFASYDAILNADGWQIFNFDVAHTYVKDGMEVSVQAGRDGDRTTVSVSELGGDRMRADAR